MSASSRAALILLGLLALSPSLVACRASQEQSAPELLAAHAALTTLDAEHAALRTDFDRDAARPRLLVLASPT